MQNKTITTFILHNYPIKFLNENQPEKNATGSFIQHRFFFYINEFTLHKLQEQMTCFRLKIYGINPVSNLI